MDLATKSLEFYGWYFFLWVRRGGSGIENGRRFLLVSNFVMLLVHIRPG